MYVKDMPSVASSACREEDLDAGRMDEDSVLEGAIDDRIAAAYAIVELGERDSKKVSEFASSELDEELEAEDLDQYHQVPRSPEYCRRDRRCKYDPHRSSADSSPVRRSLIESHPLRSLGHVRGAVMPSRTSGKPEPKLPPKRRTEDEGSGIKAKLARMLFEKRVSQTDEKETETRFKDSDDEQPIERQGGRFVRTSMPILEPVNVVSCVQSPARFEQKDKRENLEVMSEQSLSVEEISRLRESLLRKRTNEEPFETRSLRQDVSLFDNTTVSSDPAYRSAVTSPRCMKSSTQDLVIPAGLSPSPAFPNSSEVMQDLPSVDQKLSQFPPQIGAGEYFLRDGSPLVAFSPSWPMIRGLPPYLFLGPAGEPALNSTAQLGDSKPTVVKSVMPGTGFVQYFVLPATNSATYSSNPAATSDYRDSKVTEPTKMKHDVDDAMTKLENFTLGKQFYGGFPSGLEMRSSDAVTPYWCPAAPVKTFGSLNSISNYYSLTNSPASSETGLYPTKPAVSRSCNDLTRIPSRSPKARDVPQDLPRRPSPDVKYRRPKSNESAQERLATRVCKSRRKIVRAACALDMVRGGEFGSLAAIRKFYGGMKSRSAPNLSEQPSKKMQSQNCADVAQDFPLDLSSYRRKLSTEQTIQTKHCLSELRSFSTCENSVPVKVNADLSSPWQQDSHAHTGSCDRSSDSLLLQQQKANVSEPLHSSSVGVTAKNSPTPSLASNSLSRILPNSSLPPKKRKLRQPSQSRDFSGVKADSKRDFGTSEDLRVAQSEDLEMHKESAVIGSPTQTGFVLTPEMKLLENKVGVRDEDGDLPLHIAVAKGYLEFVQKVLLPMMSQNGVPIDSCNHQRQTALHLAVITNQPQMVEALLKGSASAGVCDRKGNTAVHLAVKYNTSACLRYILSNSRVRLDLDAKNYEGLTALHLGVQLGEKEVVKALLASGANPNAMDGTNGRTPLFYAVETNDYVMASVLLKCGSDPCIASYSGCTPLQIATAKSFRDMTNMLERSFPRGLSTAGDQEESYGRPV